MARSGSGRERGAGIARRDHEVDLAERSAGRDFLIIRAKAGAVTVVQLAQVAWVSARRI